MKKPLAKPETWEGFRPIAYSLDPKMLRLGLTRVTQAPEGKKQAVPTDLGEAFADLSSREIRESDDLHIEFVVPGEPPLYGTKFVTDTGDAVFAGHSFNRDLLQTLLELKKEGVNGFAATWFWYESDSSMDEPMDAHHFFVVHESRIVRERVSFVVGNDSGFDPSVFESEEPTEDRWENETEWWEARLWLWYRKFYQDTRTGQLMVLRPDKPTLHYYSEGRWRPDVAFGLLQGRLLWLMALLALCAVLLLWR